MLGHPRAGQQCPVLLGLCQPQPESGSARRSNAGDCPAEGACCEHQGTTESPAKVLEAKSRVWVPAQGAAIPVGSRQGMEKPCCTSLVRDGNWVLRPGEVQTQSSPPHPSLPVPLGGGCGLHVAGRLAGG